MRPSPFRSSIHSATARLRPGGSVFGGGDGVEEYLRPPEHGFAVQGAEYAGELRDSAGRADPEHKRPLHQVTRAPLDLGFRIGHLFAERGDSGFVSSCIATMHLRIASRAGEEQQDVWVMENFLPTAARDE